MGKEALQHEPAPGSDAGGDGCLVPQTLLQRLESLYRHLDEEGWHVHANTVALAIERLERIEEGANSEPR